MAKRGSETGRSKRGRGANEAPSTGVDPADEGFIKVRVACDPEYAEMFGCTAERLWAEPTGRKGVYRIDNIPTYTEAVRYNDLVRVVAKADPPGVHDLAKIVEYSGHVTFLVIVVKRDRTMDPEKDPAIAPLWKAWRKIDKLGFGCSYSGDNSHGVYVLAIDAPPGADLAVIAEILNAGEAAEHWAWAGGARREGDPG